jgi:hypothetical protein
MAKTAITILAAGLLLVTATAVGASAFTAATVERSANANVVADDAGLVGLTDGNSGNLVFQNGNDQLEIDTTAGTASGVNTDARFELGNLNAPTSSYAFTIRNNDAEAHTFNLTYTLNDAGSEDGFVHVEYQVYDNTGTQVGTATEEGGLAQFDAQPGERFYVVVVFDTAVADGSGGEDVETSTSDLSGTLRVAIDDVDEGGTTSDGS